MEKYWNIPEWVFYNLISDYIVELRKNRFMTDRYNRDYYMGLYSKIIGIYYARFGVIPTFE